MKSRSFLSIEKNVIKSKKKSLIIIIRNYLEKDLKSSFDEEYIKAKHQDVFWGNNFKPTNLLQKANLDKKVENYKLTKL